jgi:sugar transferase (PEP-CTERM system associated)
LNHLIRTFRRFSNPLAVLLPADFLAAYVSLYLGCWVRFGFSLEAAVRDLGPIAPRAASFAAFVVVALVTVGMYRARQRPTLWEIVARVLVAVLLGGFADVLFFYLFPSLNTGRTTMAIAMIGSFLLISLARFPLLKFLDGYPAKRRILVVGSGRVATRVAQLRRRADRRRFEIVGYLPGGPAERQFAEQTGLEPLLSGEQEVGTLRFEEIVVALDDRRGHFPTDHLLRHRYVGIPVLDIVDFLEQETGTIELDVLRPGWLIFASSGHAKGAFQVFKRLLDIVASSVFLVVVSPLFVAVTVAIWLEDGFGMPVLYRQRRVGRGGQVFEVVKFRSMHLDAERDSGPQWAAADDDRITRTGRFMRRFRIDELPQFVSVLKGEMSLVGPRPERPEFVGTLAGSLPMYDYRHCVRPGLTGWAQLNFCYGASVEDAEEKLKYDLFYIKNASIILDLVILLQTLEVVIWGRGISMAGPQERVPVQGTGEQPRQLQLIALQKRDVA